MFFSFWEVVNKSFGGEETDGDGRRWMRKNGGLK